MTIVRALGALRPGPLVAMIGVAAPHGPASADVGPLRIEITEGVIEPVPIVVAPFIAENAAATDYARELTGVVASDLNGTGLFRNLPREAYISQITDFNAPVAYADWKAINAEALVVGAVTLGAGAHCEGQGRAALAILRVHSAAAADEQTDRLGPRAPHRLVVPASGRQGACRGS